MNNPNIYRQYDDRWGKLPYPGSGATLSDSGCGCLAVYHCAIELADNAKLTVPDCRKFMVKYADVKNGTYWSGITEGLKHYGYKVHWNQNDSMADIFSELKDSCKCGVILFCKDYPKWAYGPDGTLWTTIGHYIAFADYKIENGKHWFYMKDSGSRKHDGWYSYESSMKGCVRNVWICKSSSSKPAPAPTPEPTPTPRPSKYNGNYPVVKKYLEPGDRGEQVIRLQQYLNWWSNGAFFKECGAADGVYGSNTLRWVKKMQAEFFGAKEADGTVGPKTIAKMKEVGGYEEKPKYSGHTVIDISEFQDFDIDFNKVKADGVKGVIVRCGRRGGGTAQLSEDPWFLKHITAAYKAGLKVGIYFFTEAINEKEGREEAQYTLTLLKKAGANLDYPIAVDSENVFWKEKGKKYAGRANDTKLSKANRTKAIYGFCDELKKKGYDSMIYASTSWLNNQLDMSKLQYNVWCAQCNKECQYKGKYILWQYTSEGNVNGIKEVVDLNHCYVDPKNPYTKPTTVVTTPPAAAKPVSNTVKEGKAYSGAYPETDARIALANQANFLAYQTSTSKAKYPDGQPTVAYKNALASLPASKHSWCKAAKLGANCDVFVWTAVVTSGVDKNYPSGLWKQLDYMKKNFTRIKTSEAKPGDIGFYRKDVSGTHGHIFFCYSDGKVKEASHNSYYPKTNKGLSTRLSTKGKKYVYVFRPKGNAILVKGCRGPEVTKLQEYLNWYFDGAFFKECGKADGVYGDKTLKWVKKMQTDFFGAKEADGSVGPKTVAKMKEVRK